MEKGVLVLIILNNIIILGIEKHKSYEKRKFKILRREGISYHYEAFFRADDIVYKVWCLVNGPREGGDYAIYTVLYFEEVPQEILEIEKRIESDTKRLRQYWQSMDC